MYQSHPPSISTSNISFQPWQTTILFKITSVSDYHISMNRKTNESPFHCRRRLSSLASRSASASARTGAWVLAAPAVCATLPFPVEGSPEHHLNIINSNFLCTYCITRGSFFITPNYIVKNIFFYYVNDFVLKNCLHPNLEVYCYLFIVNILTHLLSIYLLNIDDFDFL